MNSKRNDLITGIVLALFALWYFYESTGIKAFAGLAGKSPVTSSTMPKIWAVCLLLLSAALILRAIRAPKGKSAGSKFSLGDWCKTNSEVLLTFLALFVYAALMAPLGFIISSILYIFAQTIILMGKDRNYVKALIIAVVCSVASYCVFVYGLAVLLPVGAIFG